MPATLTSVVVDGAAGNTLTLVGTGLGTTGTVTLGSQGVKAVPNLTPSTISLSVTSWTDTAVSVLIPDGAMDGTITVLAVGGSPTCSLRMNSQYVTAAEYTAAGEGVDLSSLAAGELDNILRRSSSYADQYMGGSIRQIQTLDQQKYRTRQDCPPKLFPLRTRGRKVPILTVDQLTFVSAQNLVTVFNTTDMYLNIKLNYIEILAYAIGNYALLGALEIIGYSANVLELAYTSGYPVAKYPSEVRAAVTTIATELLTYRRIQAQGLGGLSVVKQGTQQYNRRNEPFQVPDEAKQLLRPYIGRIWA